MKDLKLMLRKMVQALRQTGCDVLTIPLRHDLPAFQKKLYKFNPDVVFNQYEDVVHGALYEMRFAAMIRMMGYPLTGSPALALGLHRDKYMAASLLQGAGVLVPPQTALIERIGDVDKKKWQFPLIVQASREHAGVGLNRNSVVYTKKALRLQAAHIVRNFGQPALVETFLEGREFNVGIVGGRRIRVLPIAEVDYSMLSPDVPRIMSYAAKFIETSEEYKKTRVTCPAEVEPELVRELSSTALRAFRAIGGWGYGRVDIRLDSRGIPRVLEVNCNPSLEPKVAIARSAECAEISYPQLLRLIIKAAFEGPPFDANVEMLRPAQNRPPPPQAVKS
jgi:D-alanine-D-alanine ligase